MQIQPVRGTKDILPDDHSVYLELLQKAREVASNYGYRELATPIFEFSEVFTRSLGDYSDIVSKEMYNFEDRSGQSITLRPEHTAAIARAVISNGMQQLLPLKLFTIGPTFRYERPQKGRQRQFHQMSIEAIGYSNPIIDAETIALGAHILKSLNVLDKTKLEINTLGDNESRSNYLDLLIKYLDKYKNDLSEDSKLRLEKNPLRILDSKDETDKKIVAGVPSIYDTLTTSAKKFFDDVLDNLTKLNIDYKVNHNIVRGLDYYCHTAFEFITTELGSQGTVLGGGRYDSLYKILGNIDIPAIGFAIGIERLMELYAISNPPTPLKRGLTIIGIDPNSHILALQIAEKLRMENILVHLELNNNLSKALKKAVAKNSKFAIVIGDEEMKSDKYKIKNLDQREETTLSLDEIITYVKKS